MYTVSDIIAGINRGCIANNMIEDRFRYRIIYFVNEGNNGVDKWKICSFAEQIISYSFSLDGYFRQISGECADRNGGVNYNRYAMI